MRVAIVHDWLVTWRGGEKVLEAIASLYPDAPIYTLFCDRSIIPETLSHRNIIVHPFANKLKMFRKLLLPILPVWIETFDMSGFDLVISTSSCVAKGVIPDPDARHLCYIHSPMRYVWDQRNEYLSSLRKIPFIRFCVDLLSTFLRVWDSASANRVDLFVANSNFVRRRVQKYYGRNAIVIPPPVNVEKFTPANTHKKKGYFLAAGAFVGYKRFDLAIAACEKLGRKLIVAGQGPDLLRLKSLAGKNTTIVDSPNDKVWVELMRDADAFLFPGIEDFGITAIEAMAAGTPLIARKVGGAMDFVVEGETGVFFENPDVDSLCEAIRKYDQLSWSQEHLIAFARKFGQDGFKEKIRVTIEELVEPEISRD